MKSSAVDLDDRDAGATLAKIGSTASSVIELFGRCATAPRTLPPQRAIVAAVPAPLPGRFTVVLYAVSGGTAVRRLGFNVAAEK